MWVLDKITECYAKTVVILVLILIILIIICVVCIPVAFVICDRSTFWRVADLLLYVTAIYFFVLYYVSIGLWGYYDGQANKRIKC